MTKELLQQALDEAKADAIYVFTYQDGISAASKDAIEYMHSWLTVYFDKQALAQQEQPAQEAVAYELEAVKFANGKKLVYQKPENLASYIKVRTLVYADADPAPTQPAFTQEQPAQKPDLWKTQFLTDVMTSAGLLMYGRTDKKLAQRIADGSARWRTELYTQPAPTQPAFTQEPPAKTGAIIQAIVTSCLACTHRRYNSGGIYYCEKLGSDLDPRETFHPLCPLQPLSPTQPALSDDEILNCFYASKSEGMVAYMLAVGRAIEAHCRRGADK